MSAPDLLPCPFCGGAELKVFDNSVDCKSCGATGPDLGHCVGEKCRAEAISGWNRRADLADADAARIADLERQLADARLAVALAYKRAADAIEANPQPCSPAYPDAWTDDQIARYESGQLDAANSFQTAILALAPTDALAELNALRAERDALREARIAFQNVDCQVEDEGEFTERAWAQLRAALQPTTQAQEGEG